MAEVAEEYQSSWIAEFLHKFPHFDLQFKHVNSTFDLHDRIYLEVWPFTTFMTRWLCYFLHCSFGFVFGPRILEAVYSSCRSNGKVSLILVFLLLLDVALCSNYLHVYSMYALLVWCHCVF